MLQPQDSQSPIVVVTWNGCFHCFQVGLKQLLSCTHSDRIVASADTLKVFEQRHWVGLGCELLAAYQRCGLLPSNPEEL